jgi:predicted GIY-YIG superfamily endonuclease
VVYTESCENRSTASKRECEIKKMTKEAKNKLIGKYK